MLPVYGMLHRSHVCRRAADAHAIIQYTIGPLAAPRPGAREPIATKCTAPPSHPERPCC